MQRNKISTIDKPDAGKETRQSVRGQVPVLAGTVTPSTHEVRGYRREHVIAQIQSTTLVNLLQRHAAGEIEMAATQVQSARILLDRTLPTLAATEVTHVNDDDKLSEHQILAKLQALLAARPELLDTLLEARASVAQVVGQVSEVHDRGGEPQAFFAECVVPSPNFSQE